MSSEPITRELRIVRHIAALVENAIANHIASAEEAAADSAGDADDDKPVVAKLSISVRWAAGNPNPEIEVKASHSVKRTTQVTALLDDPQLKLGVE